MKEVILGKTDIFCPAFLHISLMRVLKFNLLSVFTPNSFSHVLLQTL